MSSHSRRRRVRRLANYEKLKLKKDTTMGFKVDPNKVAPGHRRNAYTRTLVIREYFLKHPNIPVWLLDLREAQKEAHCYEDDHRIQQSINNTRAQGAMNIEAIVRGQCWVYKPSPRDTVMLAPDGRVVSNPDAYENIGGSATRNDPVHIIEAVADTMDNVIKQLTPSERLYREKMMTKSGDRILEDEDGILFRARELDLE